MAVEITATIAETASIWLVDTRLTSFDAIADPVGYVSTEAVYQEIISRAGLDETVSFVSARLVSTGSTGTQLYYDLEITFGVPPENTMTHSHTSASVSIGLGDAYGVDPLVTLDPSLGPIILTYSDDSSVDYFRIRTDTGTTVRDLFYVKQGGEIELGAHETFRLDGTYDIGSADAGTTPKRPRDIYLANDLIAGGDLSGVDGTFTGSLTAAWEAFTPQASNPDTDPTARLIYVNSVDDTLRYWDGSSETILGAAGSGTPTQGTYDCGVDVVVGDVVYVTGADTVGRASSSVLDNRAPVGVCTSKPTTTSCVVRYVGELALYAGLTSGAPYWVGVTPGSIASSPPTTEGETACFVGIARSATTLVLSISEPKKL